MQFIQEASFSRELDQITTNRDRDDLACCIEEACWKNRQQEFVYVRWSGLTLLVWFCVNGDSMTLRHLHSDLHLETTGRSLA